MPFSLAAARTPKPAAPDRPVVQGDRWELVSVHQIDTPDDIDDVYVLVTVDATVDVGAHGLIRARCIDTGEATDPLVVHSQVAGARVGELATGPAGGTTTVHIEARRTNYQTPGAGVRLLRSAATAVYYWFGPGTVARYPVGYDPTDPPPWPDPSADAGGVHRPATLPAPLPPPVPFTPGGPWALAEPAVAALAALDPVTPATEAPIPHRPLILVRARRPIVPGTGPPAPSDAVVFRSQQTLATAGTPPHVLTALGYTGNAAIARADLDDILDDHRVDVGGDLRTCTDAASFAAAAAAAIPGDVIRATAPFTVPISGSGSLAGRGNLYGIGGTTMTTSPAGGVPDLPIIFTCADGVEITGSGMTNNVPVLDLVNTRHVWAVGFNVAGNSQFGIREINWGGSATHPAYIAYCNVGPIRDAGISAQGWFQLIASSGGTPPPGAGNEWGFSQWFVIEENDVFDPNPTDIPGNPGEGIYLGRGSAPGYVSYSKDWWVRGNRVDRYKGNAYEAKPGCHRGLFSDNVAVRGRGQNGAPFEICYQPAIFDSRPAWMNNLDGAGSGDIEIGVEANRIYDFNITETGQSRNQAIIIGMAGAKVANNLLWSARDLSGNFGPASNMAAVLVQTEKGLADFGDTATAPTWIVNNNWQANAISNPGAGGTPIAGIIQRNNIVPNGHAGGTHNSTPSDYRGSVPAVGALGTAEWNGHGPGSAFDLDPTGAVLPGSGDSIADLDLYIDADISGRPIPTVDPNPGPFQPVGV